MNLRDAILQSIGDNGIEITRLRLTLRDYPVEQVDAVLCNLLRTREVERRGPLLARPVKLTTHGRCSVCGKPQPEAWMLETGICLTCASEQAVAAEDVERETLRAGRKCSCCGEVKPPSMFTGHYTFCGACKTAKNRDWEARRTKRRAAARAAKSGEVPSWKTLQDRIKAIETTPPGASYSASSSRSRSGRSASACG